MRLFIFIILLLFFSSAYAQESNKQICIKNTCITAEVADTDLRRQQGLMFRKSLPENEGMLFVFNKEDRYNFWMKNMLIPLDFIWISRDKRIIDIMTGVEPCVDACGNLIPKEKAKYVLEVNSGFVNKHKIKLGYKVFLDTKDLSN
jgi:hypothetical protein